MEPVGYTLFVPDFFVSISLSGSFDGLSEQLLVVLICPFWSSRPNCSDQDWEPN